jgi:RNA polymerase sigma-70 factor (ECF subfamily)
MPPSIDVVPTGDREIGYAKLRKDLERIVARLCPGWLSSQRDDLVQTAVMRVMQTVGAETPRADGSRGLASSYLYKVAHSALVDEIRRVRRRREDSLDTDEQATPQSGTPLDPQRIAASQQIGRGIQDCLSRMHHDRRLAVTLYLQGHTVPEASRILDWSAKRTENLVYRGLADLRECLKLKGMRP